MIFTNIKILLFIFYFQQSSSFTLVDEYLYCTRTNESAQYETCLNQIDQCKCIRVKSFNLKRTYECTKYVYGSVFINNEERLGFLSNNGIILEKSGTDSCSKTKDFLSLTGKITLRTMNDTFEIRVNDTINEFRLVNIIKYLFQNKPVEFWFLIIIILLVIIGFFHLTITVTKILMETIHSTLNCFS